MAADGRATTDGPWPTNGQAPGGGPSWGAQSRDGRAPGGYRVGIDVGGTFTDLAAVGPDGRTMYAKVPSVPADPSVAVLAALSLAFERRSGLTDPAARPMTEAPPAGWIERFAHGTTVATNALLERAGARTALVTTHGFRDVLEIGRQNRPSLYDLTRDRPASLVPRELRFTVRERCGPDGVLEPLTAAEIDRVVERVAGVEGLAAVAVCLLFSFAWPEHELAVADALRARLPAVTVVASSEVLPAFREYERFATAAADAYLTPKLSSYLTRLRGRLAEAGIGEPLVMQSSGGVAALAEAAAHAATCVLSGPAGGVVGAAYVAGLSGVRDLLTFDMGGTSTDVAPVLDGQALTTSESVLAGVPIMLPTVDVHSVSAGGGSIAWVDSGGALRVGPASAGADPGPACYQRGGHEATVTDADLVLGYLGDGASLGGEVTLSTAAATAALERLGARLGLSALAAAAGVVAVADAEMTRALRVVSVERGLDPRALALVAFGGAGGTHACALAEALGMTTVLVPRAAGVLSALGLALGDVRRDHAAPLRGRLGEVDLAGAFDRLTAAALQASAGADEADQTARTPRRGGSAGTGAPREPDDELRLDRWVDCRYVGQAHELTVSAGPTPARSGGDAEPAEAEPAEDVNRALAAAVRTAFEAEHSRRYGHLAPERDVEVVAVRLVATLPGVRPALAAEPADPAALRSRRGVWLDGAWHEVDVVARSALGAGAELPGPAVVEFAEATTLVRPGWTARVDPVGTLVLMHGRDDV
ncbi:hydantoinase/oxoprolinase family protein [Pseudofrankia inefficax]|uniref:5-oxoprolinase (ATP-hydrolyzing) n=1 Tax=Pseudofrankia inefficax (strain DSM 45817 / CECT 9037 / DDB 130130 / EuI1c) TaxID=298654 RepID=E3IW59_PSEI1|nr:hydantoinase/oxoprolinase family protein [Pseudofrankia inefficax]ADP78901.1 5-oxoprolinase (ATP-hydrolyzing) [Pseudofrankia inefficax]